MLRRMFTELEVSGHSFIYRLLGGIRGSNTEIEKLTNFITTYDRLSVKKKVINPNNFYFIDLKK